MVAKIALQIALVLVLNCWSLSAQDSTSKSSEINKIDNFFNDMQKDESGKINPPNLPFGLPQFEMDEKTHMEFNRSMQEYYSYRSSGYAHRRHVFEWQLFSSKIIFYVVICLVTIGLVFSGIQFYAAHKKNFVDEKVTEISASTSGIKVSSSVLGVIILIISLLFFYLYLVYVYPISEIF